jgi:acyl-CoA reductase-like NAD-dependent aldehyde dehydrogenase
MIRSLIAACLSRRPMVLIAYVAFLALGLAAFARLNIEADSLNAAILAPDIELSSETGGLFLGDVVRDMTQKAGQKCTAIRRVLVPEARFGEVCDS